MISDHPQRFRIIGFCDAAEKKHGTDDCTHFRQADCFTVAHIPSQDQLREYASLKGYWPSKKRGSTLAKCEPLCVTTCEGLEFLKCKICWPQRAVPIDNRPAPG